MGMAQENNVAEYTSQSMRIKYAIFVLNVKENQDLHAQFPELLRLPPMALGITIDAIILRALHQNDELTASYEDTVYTLRELVDCDFAADAERAFDIVAAFYTEFAKETIVDAGNQGHAVDVASPVSRLRVTINKY